MANFLFAVVLSAWFGALRSEDVDDDTVGSKIDGPVIGIDLGTTYSCVGIMKKSGVEIIPNDQGNRITPSYVSFSKSGRLIGEAAKNEATLQPTQTLYDVKRLIGRRFSDTSVQEDMKSLPFKIVDEDEKLKVAVSAMGEIKHLTPEEISAMVISKLKETAEAFLGKDVKHAVITVPAYFNNAQREATKDAGKIAGLEVLRIVNEPTAAAMAYGLDKKDETNILVYDLGGGTFDVSLLTVAEGAIEVLATNGDTHLGGEDFDQRVVNHLLTLFRDKHEKDLSNDKVAMQKLKKAAELAKMTLSTKKEANIEIEGLFEGMDFSEKLTRAKFEELNLDLFKKTLAPVKQVLEDGKLSKTEVDEIVFVGGSTRIPKIQDLLTNFFGGKKPNLGLNPDEAVAYGASVQAGILGGTAAEDIVLLDVTPITLGIETAGGIFDKIVPRNSAIPVKKSKSFVTSVPDTTETHIKVFEGERPLTKDNSLLDQFTLSGFPKGPKGMSHDVVFDIDANGILTVTATIQKSGKTAEITISKDKSRLTSEQIEEMIKNNEAYAEEDEKALAKAKKMNELDIFIKETEINLNKGPRKEMAADDLAKVEEALSSGKKFVKQEDQELEDIEAKLKEVKEACEDIPEPHEEDKEEDDDNDEELDIDEDLDDLEEEDL